jgi:hypothetical protein
MLQSAALQSNMETFFRIVPKSGVDDKRKPFWINIFLQAMVLLLKFNYFRNLSRLKKYGIVDLPLN